MVNRTSKIEIPRTGGMGAAMKSSASSRTTAGRNLPPGVWWNCFRIRTRSLDRRVMRSATSRSSFRQRMPGRMDAARQCDRKCRLQRHPTGAPLEEFFPPGGTCDAISGRTAIWPLCVSTPLESAVWFGLSHLLCHVTRAGQFAFTSLPVAFPLFQHRASRVRGEQVEHGIFVSVLNQGR